MLPYRLPLLSLIHVAILASGCQNEKSPELSAVKADQSIADGVEFNLAKYLRERLNFKQMAGFFVEGDPYLAVGVKDMFQVQTNLTTFYANDEARTIRSEFWLDGYAFGKTLSTGNERGQILDISGQVSSRPIAAMAKLRLLGKDMFNGQLTAKYDVVFTRDISDETAFYPMPLLGLKVAGLLGGEFGLTAQLEYRDKQGVGLGFIPHVGVNGGIGGKIELTRFVQASAESHMQLIKTSLGTFTSLDSIPLLPLMLASVEVDGGKWEALKGKVVIKAKAPGIEGEAVPSDVDPKLWSKADAKGEWRHTVWESKKPVLVSSVPVFRKIVPVTTPEGPSIIENCEEKAKKFAAAQPTSEKVAENAAKIDQKDEATKAVQMNLAKAATERNQEKVKQVANFCDSLPEAEDKSPPSMPGMDN